MRTHTVPRSSSVRGEVTLNGRRLPEAENFYPVATDQKELLPPKISDAQNRAACPNCSVGVVSFEKQNAPSASPLGGDEASVFQGR